MSTSSTDPSATSRPVPRPTTVLRVAALGVLMAFVDATIVNIAFPSIERSFPDTGLSGLSWVLNAYNIVFAALLVGFGQIADLLGRRRSFRFGLALFTLASGLCAVAPSAATLIAARVVQAVGAALVVPCSLALVMEAFPPAQRAHAVALWTAVAALAAGIGPSLGGLLVSAGGWRLAFLVNLPIGVVAVVLAGRALVESRAPGQRQMPDLAGALTLAVAVGALTLAIVQGNQWGWGDARVLAALAAAAVLGWRFALRCRRHRSPVIDPALLRIRSFSVANAMTLVAAAGFFAYTLGNVLFLTGAWHYSVLRAGLALTPGPLVAVAVARPASRLAQRWRYGAVVALGALIWAAGVVYFCARLGARPAFVSRWLPGMVVLGIGAGITFPTVSAASVAAAPGGRFATATALNSVARQLGAVLGVALLVTIIGVPTPADGLHPFQHAWLFAAACFGCVALAAAALGRIAVDEHTDTDVTARGQTTVVLPSLGSAPPTPTVPRPAGDGATASVAGHRQTAAEFLGAAPLFATLSRELRDELARRARTVRIAAGEWLFRQGDQARSLYVVRAGRLDVVKGAGAEPIATLTRGSVIGELALLADAPRGASVRAVRDSVLLELGRGPFEATLARGPELGRALLGTLGAQLQASPGTTTVRRPPAATITLVGLVPGVNVRDLAEQLSEELRRWESVVVLDADASRVDTVEANAALIDRVASDGGRVLLVAGGPGAAEAWTAACLSQADRILAVTDGGAIEACVRAKDPALAGCDLLALGVRAESGALAPWIDALGPTAVHRVRDGAEHDGDMAQVARRLAGRAVGVVLSGGGARAFAHIGVLEELATAGVVVDRIAGVSMGALIGALAASGLSAEEIDARCYEEWVRRNPINDYTVPRHALIRGGKAIAMLERLFGDVAIEELPRDYYCASADIRAAELVIHRSGPLAAAVGASICLPGLAPPRRRDGRLLVDGGVLDNLPVGPMVQAAEGPVIAVDVKLGGTRGGPRAAIPDDRPLPAIAETLYRTALLGSVDAARVARDVADLLIEVRVPAVGMLEFHQLDQARAAGRRAAYAALTASAPVTPSPSAPPPAPDRAVSAR